MWRHRGPLGRARRRRVPARRHGPTRRLRPRSARSRRRSSTRARTACTSPRRRSCTEPARSAASRRCSSASSIVTLVGRHFDPHELWQTVQRERVTQMAIVGDAFAKPMLRALEEAEAAGTPYDLSSLAADHQLGRDVVGRGEAGADGSAASFICFDSLGSSEGVGFAGSITTPGAEHMTAKFTIGARTKVFTRRRHRGRAGIGRESDGSRSAATSRSATTRTRRSPTRRSSTIDGAALVGARRLRERRGRRHDHAARPRLGRHQLRRREDLPRRGRRSGEAAPGGGDCLVVGIPDERFGEAVTAVVSLRPDDRGVARRARGRARVARALQAPARVRHRRPMSCAARTARPTTSGRRRPRPARRATSSSASEPTLASTSRPLRIKRSSPSIVISVPPYFE